MPYTSNVESGGKSEPTKIIAGTATAADVRSGVNFVPNTAANQVIAGAMPNCKITEVTPSAADQLIGKGSYIANDIKIKGDSNLSSKNIKSGVTIFGVSGDKNIVDTSGASITAADMRKDKSAYSGGVLIHGSIPDNTETEITPGVSEKTIGVGQYIAKAIKILGDAKLLAENIKSGISIFGVKGTFTSDATANPADVLSGKTAYKNGGRISGTMVDRGTYAYASGIGSGNDGTEYYAFNNIPSGYYHETKGTESWSPEVRLSQESVRDYLGVAANKIIAGQSIAGIAGNQHPYGYVVGDVTSDASAAFRGGAYFYMCRFNLPFEPMVGYVIHYHSDRLRDITVFAPDNRGAKFARMMNFNQARMGGLYSYGVAQDENGAWCGRGECKIPVVYGNSLYQYFFAGYY